MDDKLKKKKKERKVEWRFKMFENTSKRSQLKRERKSMCLFSITKRNAKLPIPFPNCTIPNPPFETKIHRRITNSMERNHLYHETDLTFIP